jgi:hypothetical protein
MNVVVQGAKSTLCMLILYTLLVLGCMLYTVLLRVYEIFVVQTA